MTTSVTINRKPIFRVAGQECPAYQDSRGFLTPSDILLKAILFGRSQQWYYLLSFVVMPDHMHLIIIPRDKNISESMKSIKGFSARKINEVFSRRGSIWQKGFYDYILDSEEKVLSRIGYIENNPVRKGIVINSEDYKYSSIRYREETDFGMFF
jgi:REP element-mobilizing transposase RayT